MAKGGSVGTPLPSFTRRPILNGYLAALAMSLWKAGVPHMSGVLCSSNLPEISSIVDEDPLSDGFSEDPNTCCHNGEDPSNDEDPPKFVGNKWPINRSALTNVLTSIRPIYIAAGRYVLVQAKPDNTFCRLQNLKKQKTNKQNPEIKQSRSVRRVDCFHFVIAVKVGLS
jgi:hypothetical protein